MKKKQLKGLAKRRRSVPQKIVSTTFQTIFVIGFFAFLGGLLFIARLMGNWLK